MTAWKNFDRIYFVINLKMNTKGVLYILQRGEGENIKPNSNQWGPEHGAKNGKGDTGEGRREETTHTHTRTTPPTQSNVFFRRESATSVAKV